MIINAPWGARNIPKSFGYVTTTFTQCSPLKTCARRPRAEGRKLASPRKRLKMTRIGTRAAAKTPDSIEDDANSTRQSTASNGEHDGGEGPEAYLLDSSRPSGYKHVGREVRKKKVKFTAEIYPSGCKGRGIKLGRYSTAKVQMASACASVHCALPSCTPRFCLAGGGARRGQVRGRPGCSSRVARRMQACTALLCAHPPPSHERLPSRRRARREEERVQRNAQLVERTEAATERRGLTTEHEGLKLHMAPKNASGYKSVVRHAKRGSSYRLEYEHGGKKIKSSYFQSALEAAVEYARLHGPPS